jgi:hypothetical protein
MMQLLGDEHHQEHCTYHSPASEELGDDLAQRERTEQPKPQAAATDNLIVYPQAGDGRRPSLLCRVALTRRPSFI